MTKKIWYGVQGGNVKFAEDQTTLSGCQNVSSFEISETGDISGLNFETPETTSHQQGGQQTA